jgi:hypothetical protein
MKNEKGKRKKEKVAGGMGIYLFNLLFPHA